MPIDAEASGLGGVGEGGGEDAEVEHLDAKMLGEVADDPRGGEVHQHGVRVGDGRAARARRAACGRRRALGSRRHRPERSARGAGSGV